MLVDTDVLIWAFRGNAKAVEAVERTPDPSISIVTYMELLQGCRDKQEIRKIKEYLAGKGFRVYPLTEDIGHRAAIYVEEYWLAASVDMGDALIAATAVETRQALRTANVRHYRAIRELELAPFKP